MKVSLDIHIDAGAAVSIVGDIARRAARSGTMREVVMAECRALAAVPQDFFDYDVQIDSCGSVGVTLLPNARLVRLLRDFGGVT